MWIFSCLLQVTCKVNLQPAKANARGECFLWSLSLLNVNIEVNSLWSHPEATSLSIFRQYKRTLATVTLIVEWNWFEITWSPSEFFSEMKLLPWPPLVQSPCWDPAWVVSSPSWRDGNISGIDSCLWATSMDSTLDSRLPIVLLSPEWNITLDSLALVFVLVHFPVSNCCVRARLHWASASMPRKGWRFRLIFDCNPFLE